MSSKGKRLANARRRAENIPEVVAFCEDAGFEWHYVNGQQWQIRVEQVMDVYPTNKKYCWLPTGTWGSYTDYENLGNIFMEMGAS